MKNLTEYVSEKLIINKNYKSYKYYPKTWNELRHIIVDRYEEEGPGTEQEPIDFNDIDISRITEFRNKLTNQGLFQNTKFQYIDISNWDISNVKNMNSMFWSCEHLKSVGDLSNWDVSSVDNMNYMFRNCKNLTSVGDLSNWDVSNIEYINYMFTFTDSAITNIPDWYE